MKFSKEKALKELQNAGILVFCHMMMAFLVSAFIIPHEIIMGGATGAGILIAKLLPVDTATAVMIVRGQGFTRVRVPIVRRDSVAFPEGTEYSAKTL